MAALARSAVVVQAGLLLGLHLHDALDEVLVVHHSGVPAQRQHARLNAHRLELRRVEVLRGPPQLLKIDVVLDVHLAAVDAQDLCARVFVRVRELHLAVQPPRAHQRRVKDVRAVSRRDDLDVHRAREAVELVEQLKHGALHLAVAVGVRVKTFRANRVDLVDENDRRGLLLGQRESVAHQLGAIADEHLHQLRAGELEEGCVRLRGHGARDKRLPRARRAITKDALRGFDPQAVEAVLVRHGQHDGLDQLLNLLIQPADVGVVLGGLLIHLHRLYTAIVLGGKRVKDEVRILVDAHQVAGLELVGVHQPNDRQEDGLPRAGLEHHALALPL
mmetsp:Transcript_6297/g.18868  ORF Transcript_6297/g.18868 Transcript_6297/m.18868 type:complete len:332 (+) Transcript_6297:939-1934(+)